MSGSTHPAGDPAPSLASPGRLPTASGTNNGRVISKVPGPKRPAGQALTPATSTNKPKSSTPTSRSVAPGGKPKVTTTQSVQKAEPTVRTGQNNRTRIPNTKPASATRSTVSSRATAPTAPRKPRSLLNDTESWKAKYEAQLKETRKAQSELEKAKGEHAGKLAASEACREQADREAADAAERLVKVLADLELSQQAKDQFSIQVDYACQRIEELEIQAKLAGELQTELNSLRNVRLPTVEQEIKALKQELSQMLEDAEKSPNALACAGGACQYKTRKCPEAFPNFLREIEIYIDHLEKTCQLLESKYTEAAFEIEDLQNVVTALQTANGNLKGQYQDLMYGHNQLARDLEDLQVDKPVLRVVNIAPRTDSSCSSSSVASKHSGVVSAVEIVPSSALKPASTFSGIIARIETDARSLPKLGMASISTVVTQPTHLPSTHKPRPPLDRALQITINIEQSARAKLTLLQRLTAITTQDSTFKINGPADIVKALVHGMEDAQTRAMHNEAKVLELQQMMWSYIGELEQMKKAGCNIVEHKNLAEELAAMSARLQMQDMLLADYGRQLARFKQGRIVD